MNAKLPGKKENKGDLRQRKTPWESNGGRNLIDIFRSPHVVQSPGYIDY